MAVGTPSGAAAQESAAAAWSVPARAAGVELLGPQRGSGYRQAPSLARRADGQVLQLTPLLYRVLEAVDGERDLAQIAHEVSERTGRQLGPETVRLLVESKLTPLGLLRRPDGSEPAVDKVDPLLGLRLRYVVTDPALTRKLTAPFAGLFRPPVVVLVLLSFVVASAWVLFEKGLGSATYQAFDSPGLLLAVLGITLLSAGFHEFGHAAACRYGGATPGAMGAGLYLVWPAFYTEVSDSYRLGRGGRVRVDLGGLYFNALFAVAVVAVWGLVRADALLLLVAQLVQMARQLTPVVRFDGYHVLADLTGVPDLYARIGPALRGLLPWHWGGPESRVLKPWARAVVTAWVLTVVPLLLGLLALIVLALPRVAATAWASLGRQQDVLAADWAAGNPAGLVVRLLSMVAIVLPLAGLAYLLARLIRRTGGWTWRRTQGRPVQRGLAAGVVALLFAAVAWAWWPDGDTYRPLSPTERWTVLNALPSASVEPAGLRDGQVAAARAVWPDAAELPTRDRPALALVLVPEQAADTRVDGEATAPTWVFPVDAPAAPSAGDNQALAVNTQDGSTLYDVAFALVWADDDGLTRNEAYAFASCTACTTVAVGFQVVLVIGQVDVVVPQNISGALNYSCVQCVTYALASQLVLTLPDGLSADATAELEALWAQIMAFAQDLDDVPLAELRARLEDYKAAVLSVVEQDVARSTSGVSEDDAVAPTSSSPRPTSTPAAPPGASTSSTPPQTSATSSPAPSTASPSTSSSPSESSTPSPATSGG